MHTPVWPLLIEGRPKRSAHLTGYAIVSKAGDEVAFCRMPYHSEGGIKIAEARARLLAAAWGSYARAFGPAAVAAAKAGALEEALAVVRLFMANVDGRYDSREWLEAKKRGATLLARVPEGGGA